MQTTHVHMISPSMCKYFLHGQNLAEIRRVKLAPIARALKVKADGSKNEMLGLMIGKLNAMGAETEISAIGKTQAKPAIKKTKVKKKAKKT